MKKGLIITTQSDKSTIKAVIDQLTDEFVFFRFDIDNIINNIISLTEFEDNYYFEINGVSINLSEIDFVWYRRFSLIETTYLLNKLSEFKERKSEFNFYIYTEYKQTVLSVLNLLRNKMSINCFETFFNNNNKISNLSIAKSIGFNVPKYILSNEYEKIKKFGVENNWNIILKTFFSFDFYEKNEQFYIPVRKINFQELEKHQKSIKICPVFFQEYIEKKYELRVVLIGLKIFAFAIYSQEIEEAKIDFRIPNLFDLKYELVELPLDLKQKLLNYAEINNLDFCFFDLIFTPENKYYFLECNIDGEWYWLEKATGIKLAKEFSELVQNKSKTSANIVFVQSGQKC